MLWPALSLAALALAQIEPTTCNEERICCAEWIIDLRKDDGRVWGAITAKSYSEVQRKLEQARESERGSCRFFDQEYPCSKLHYESPDRPRCYGAKERPPEGDACAADVRGRIEALEARANQQVSRATVQAGATDSLRVHAEAALGRPMKLPFSNVAGVAAGYGDALSRVQRLKQTMDELCVPKPENSTDRLFGQGKAFGRVRTGREGAELRAAIDVAEQSLGESGSPGIQMVNLSMPHRVVMRGGGPAQIVLSCLGKLTEGAIVPAGPCAVAAAYVDGATPVLRPVKASTSWENFPNAHVFRINVAGMERVLALIPLIDSDQDGVPDERDECPQRKGVAPKGCPPDSDGDGVLDDVDQCPNQKGSAAANGCVPTPPVARAQPALVATSPANSCWAYSNIPGTNGRPAGATDQDCADFESVWAFRNDITYVWFNGGTWRNVYFYPNHPCIGGLMTLTDQAKDAFIRGNFSEGRRIATALRGNIVCN